MDLGTFDAGTSLDLIGILRLSSLCKLDISGTTIRGGALDCCLCLTSLTLHHVWLTTELLMPESLQTLSLSYICVHASLPAFPPYDADSFSFCLDFTSAKEFRELEMHKTARDIAVRLPPCVKKVGITCTTLDYGRVEHLFTGLTALEDVRVEVCKIGHISHTGVPYFSGSLLQTIISAPIHYFEWQWENTYSRQVEVAEQHDVLKNFAADVMCIPNPHTKPHLLIRRTLREKGHTHMKMWCILVRGYSLSSNA